jgi:hypothetical protein
MSFKNSDCLVFENPSYRMYVDVKADTCGYGHLLVVLIIIHLHTENLEIR